MTSISDVVSHTAGSQQQHLKQLQCY